MGLVVVTLVTYRDFTVAAARNDILELGTFPALVAMLATFEAGAIVPLSIRCTLWCSGRSSIILRCLRIRISAPWKED